jgi:hypothetical protein
LGAFDADALRARRAYARFIEEALETGHVSEFYAVQEQQILGSDRFSEEISTPRRRSNRRHGKTALGFDDLMARVSRATHVPLAVIKGRSRTGNVYRARAILCYAAISLAGFPACKVAETLERDASNITRAVVWVERMDTKELERLLQQVFGQK